MHYQKIKQRFGNILSKINEDDSNLIDNDNIYVDVRMCKKNKPKNIANPKHLRYLVLANVVRKNVQIY